MNVEIERKFLVNTAKWKRVAKKNGQLFRQGYLSADPRITMRVRVAHDRAWLTIKGKTQGISRPEFEYEIPMEDANELLEKFSLYEIQKVRHEVRYKGKVWEVDEFRGENEGLIVAEIELDDEEENISLPQWIESEITNDARYSNSNLAMHPFINW